MRTPDFKAWFGDWEAVTERESERARIQSWIAPETVDQAKRKTKEEIVALFGNKPEPIAVMPDEYMSLFGPVVADDHDYCGKGYFLDHS